MTKDFIKHPLLGYGVTGYKFLDAQYPRVLAETGFAGFFSFIALLIAIYKNALQTRRRYEDDPFYLGVSTGFLAGFFAMLSHAIGSNTFIIFGAILIMIPQIAHLPDTSESHQRLMKPI